MNSMLKNSCHPGSRNFRSDEWRSASCQLLVLWALVGSRSVMWRHLTVVLATVCKYSPALRTTDVLEGLLLIQVARDVKLAS